jgi:hypothetical protein
MVLLKDRWQKLAGEASDFKAEAEKLPYGKRRRESIPQTVDHIAGTGVTERKGPFNLRV